MPFNEFNEWPHSGMKAWPRPGALPGAVAEFTLGLFHCIENPRDFSGISAWILGVIDRVIAAASILLRYREMMDPAARKRRDDKRACCLLVACLYRERVRVDKRLT